MVLLLVTGSLTAAVATIHLWLGGRDVARPLLSTDGLPPMVRYTTYYCWHLVTIVLYAMAAGFAASAFVPESRILVTFLALSATAFSIWGFALVAIHRRSLAELPQGILFLPIAALGCWAALA